MTFDDEHEEGWKPEKENELEKLQAEVLKKQLEYMANADKELEERRLKAKIENEERAKRLAGTGKSSGDFGCEPVRAELSDPLPPLKLTDLVSYAKECWQAVKEAVPQAPEVLKIDLFFRFLSLRVSSPFGVHVREI